MRNYSIVLFDLDGTLIESGPGIITATRAMMRELNIKDRPDDEMKKFIGPPLVTGFSELLGLHGDELTHAIRLYRQKYDELGLAVTKAYPGIPELLSKLKQLRKKVGVVTAKNQAVAEVHLKKFGLWPYIDYLKGADASDNGNKTELLKKTITEFFPPETTAAVMVGDRLYDLNAAHDVGMDSIGVMYGYGSREEITGCTPTMTAENVEELTRLLSNPQ